MIEAGGRSEAISGRSDGRVAPYSKVRLSLSGRVTTATSSLT